MTEDGYAEMNKIRMCKALWRLQSNQPVQTVQMYEILKLVCEPAAPGNFLEIQSWTKPLIHWLKNLEGGAQPSMVLPDLQVTLMHTQIWESLS